MTNYRSKGSGCLFRRTEEGPWILAYYNYLGRRIERSTRTTDRRTAERILAKQVADDALRRDGVLDPRAEAIALQGRRSIVDQLNEWKESLKAKGVSEHRIYVAFSRAQHVIKNSSAKALQDLDPVRVTSYIRQLQNRGFAARTINGYIQAAKQFVHWAVVQGRLTYNPLAGVQMVKVVGQTRNRRPLLAEELNWLIRAAEVGPKYRRMSGTDRAMLYRVATGTGFRKSELASLTRGCFNLGSRPPTVVVAAGYSKRRREDVQPIRSDLAALLKRWIKTRPDGEPVFSTMPEKLVHMIERDLRRARDMWVREAGSWEAMRRRWASDFLLATDPEGRVVDFHALRATYITLLVKGGASVKVAQELARHSDPKLTMNVYTKLGIHDLSGALESLPGVGTERQKEVFAPPARTLGRTL